MAREQQATMQPRNTARCSRRSARKEQRPDLRGLWSSGRALNGPLLKKGFEPCRPVGAFQTDEDKPQDTVVTNSRLANDVSQIRIKEHHHRAGLLDQVSQFGRCQPEIEQGRDRGTIFGCTRCLQMTNGVRTEDCHSPLARNPGFFDGRAQLPDPGQELAIGPPLAAEYKGQTIGSLLGAALVKISRRSHLTVTLVKDPARKPLHLATSVTAFAKGLSLTIRHQSHTQNLYRNRRRPKPGRR